MKRAVPSLAVAVSPNLKASFKNQALPFTATLSVWPFVGSSSDRHEITVDISQRVKHPGTESGLIELRGQHDGRSILIKWHTEYINACFLYYSDGD